MKTVYMVAGLAFGDEGKGATVDFLTQIHNAGLVVRYNGGSQAGHNVVTSDGRWHTFSQFGSGTFHPGVKTHLSEYMLVNPENMMRENAHLHELGIHDAIERLTVSEDCLIITPFDRAINHLLEESRGENHHGTCGHGVGRCRSEHLKHGDKVLFAGDLKDKEKTRKKLLFIQQEAKELSDFILKAYPLLAADPFIDGGEAAINICCDRYHDWERIVRVVHRRQLKYLLEETDCTIFEGAQGVLLDENYGTAPYNTWTDTTFNNALKLLEECNYRDKKYKVGVLRSYYTRHGEGPFPTEEKTISFPEPHNNGSGWQGKFRFGYFDFRALNYAMRICGGVDFFALNHLDQKNIVSGLERFTGVPIRITGWGPTLKDRKLR